jgi:hypothetical protein
MKKSSFLFAAALTLAFAAGVAHAEPSLKLNAPLFDAPPKIDGVLDDAAWVTAAAECGKTVIDINHTADAIAAYPRVAYVGYDKDALYFAFVIMSDKELVGEEGGSIWGEDQCEIFLQPDPAAGYAHIGININGFNLTEIAGGDDPGWDLSAIKVAKSKSGIANYLEVAVPFKATGMAAPKSGTTWKINLNGHQTDGDMWLAANATYGGFHNPERFMDLSFE